MQWSDVLNSSVSPVTQTDLKSSIFMCFCFELTDTIHIQNTSKPLINGQISLQLMDAIHYVMIRCLEFERVTSDTNWFEKQYFVEFKFWINGRNPWQEGIKILINGRNPSMRWSNFLVSNVSPVTQTNLKISIFMCFCFELTDTIHLQNTSKPLING